MIYITSPHVGDNWKLLQEQFIAGNTHERFKWLPFDVPKGCHHLKALHYCLEVIKNEHPQQDDLIVEMDSDAFPISIEWVQKVRSYLLDNEFVAVQRLENPNFYKKIAHPCFCAWYYKTKIDFAWIARNPYIDHWEERKWKPLHRSNKKNLHRQLYAIYDDIVYHHGAGSRKMQVANEHFFMRGMRYYEDIHKNPIHFVNYLRGK